MSDKLWDRLATAFLIRSRCKTFGHADAAAVNISFTLPDGSVQHPFAGLGLVAGGTAQTSVAFTVPATQASGPATATLRLGWIDAAGNAYGVESATVTTTIASQTAAISDFNPKQGPAGTVVSILGTNLSVSGGPTTVSFAGPNNGSLSARTTFANATQLDVVVPDGAVTGPIQVTNPTGSVTSAAAFTVGPRQDFTVTVAPSIATVPQSSTTSLVVSVTSPQTPSTAPLSLPFARTPEPLRKQIVAPATRRTPVSSAICRRPVSWPPRYWCCRTQSIAAPLQVAGPIYRVSRIIINSLRAAQLN